LREQSRVLLQYSELASRAKFLRAAIEQKRTQAQSRRDESSELLNSLAIDGTLVKLIEFLCVYIVVYH
jgi:hypothetical protein